MLLQPAIKNYSWGKIGSNSLVSQLFQSQNQKSKVDEKSPFAELWMGTHPSGSSLLISNGESLLNYVSNNHHVLGEKVYQQFGSSLPFLLKVLSVETALSIQAHPDKNLAKILHKNDPGNYSDDNHKPELAIALTPFEVLVGFRSLSEIRTFIKDIPELGELVGEAPLETPEDLRQIFTKLLKTPPEIINESVLKLMKRENVEEKELVHRLNSQFPGDVGIFCSYFLQHLRLEPGEAIFLPADEPHAYLYGDCIECMANSDNVVRAGLTPKFKDINVLADMLTFKPGQNLRLGRIEIDEGHFLYSPPVQEFSVEYFNKSNDFTIEKRSSCSIGIVIEGTGTFNKEINLNAGSVIFIPCDTECLINVESAIKLYLAFCPTQ